MAVWTTDTTSNWAHNALLTVQAMTELSENIQHVREGSNLVWGEDLGQPTTGAGSPARFFPLALRSQPGSHEFFFNGTRQTSGVSFATTSVTLSTGFVDAFTTGSFSTVDRFLIDYVKEEGQ